MTSPGMIGADRCRARARRLKGSAKIGKSKQRHAVANSLCIHLIIEGARGLAELGQQIALRAGVVRLGRIGRSFVGMRVESAQRAKEYLAMHAERVFDLD